MGLQATLRPATEDDVPVLVTIGRKAFGFDAISQAFFPESREPDLVKRLDADFRWRCGMAKRGLTVPQRHYLVAEEPRGEGGGMEIVGWAGWELLVPAEGENEQSEEERRRQFDERAKAWPAIMDGNALRSFLDTIQEATDKFMGNGGTKDMWTLNSIAVDPKHQRKGVGRLLLDWGIDKAKEQRRDVYIISMEAGRPLYLGAGFKQIGSLETFGVSQYPMLLKTSNADKSNLG